MDANLVPAALLNDNKLLDRGQRDWRLTNALLGERETFQMEEKRLAVNDDTRFNPVEER